MSIEGMKFLSLTGYFKLPDDFTGTVSEALRMLADYHDNEGLSNPARIVEDASDPSPEQQKIWTVRTYSCDWPGCTQHIICVDGEAPMEWSGWKSVSCADGWHACPNHAKHDLEEFLDAHKR